MGDGGDAGMQDAVKISISVNSETSLSLRVHLRFGRKYADLQS